MPWLEPDIGDHLRSLAADGVDEVVVCPLGFVSDHMEVLYDLDTLAASVADEVGINGRAATVGNAGVRVDDPSAGRGTPQRGTACWSVGAVARQLPRGSLCGRTPDRSSRWTRPSS
ncbi:MAG: ferrochelatase [Acidimicrobiales bacterium]